MATEILHTENGESGIFTAWQNDVQVGEMTYKRGNVEYTSMPKEMNRWGQAQEISTTEQTRKEQMVINHTQVFDGYEGQGIARQMVMAVVDFARKEGRKIMPVCSYAKAVLTRTDEYHDVLPVGGIKPAHI